MTAADDMTNNRPVDAIILAAGKGTRMQSDLAKVLHPVADQPLVHWVARACRAVGVRRLIVVVGHQADRVQSALSDLDDCHFVTQHEQLGTGHAVGQAESFFTDQPATDTFVLCGDGPLIRPRTLQTLLATHRDQQADATLATAELADPTTYGRIIRDHTGAFKCIVEEKEATDTQLAVREVNPSYYCFNAGALFQTLDRVSNDNAKGEYYITDVFGLLLNAGRRVSVVQAVPPEDVLSINTPAQLAEVDQILRQRLAQAGE